MAVNVVRYRHDGTVRWGVVEGDDVLDLACDGASTGDLVERAPAVLDGSLRGADRFPYASVEVLSPVTADQQFLCQAINYRSHMAECGFDPATNPFNVFFTKAPSSLAPATTDIVVPHHVEYPDHEVEIGLILRRRVTGPTRVDAGELAEHVAGLVAVNDVSARDVQLAETQFYKAKSYRTFGPVGPFLALLEPHELDRFRDLHLRLWVDGELRQDAFASDMVHAPAATLTELSEVQDWGPGDLLATGTPGGCALRVPSFPLRVAALAMSPLRRHQAVLRSARRNGRRLRTGQVVEVHIGTDDGTIDLGRQRCRIVAGG